MSSINFKAGMRVSVNIPYKTREEWLELLQQGGVEMDMYFDWWLKEEFDPDWCVYAPQIIISKKDYVKDDDVSEERWENIYNEVDNSATMRIMYREAAVALTVLEWLLKEDNVVLELDRIIFLGHGIKDEDEDEDGSSSYFIPEISRGKDGRWSCLRARFPELSKGGYPKYVEFTPRVGFVTEAKKSY